MTNNITPSAIEFLKQLGETDNERTRTINVLRNALGNALLTIDTHLPDDVWQKVHDHLADADLAASQLHNQALGLLQTVTSFALLARGFQQQRDNALYELKDATDRADEAEHTVQARLYLQLLDNIQETFNCKRSTADMLLCAIWDIHSGVGDADADLLDSIANVIDEREQGF